MTYKQQYKNQLRRIARASKRLRQEGYIFNTDFIITPTRIRKESVQRLRNITPNVMRALSVKVVNETGEQIQNEGLKLTKKERRTVAGIKSRSYSNEVKSRTRAAVEAITFHVFNPLPKKPKLDYSIDADEILVNLKNCAGKLSEFAANIVLETIEDLGDEARIEMAKTIQSNKQRLIELTEVLYEASKGEDIRNITLQIMDILYHNDIPKNVLFRIDDTSYNLPFAPPKFKSYWDE